MRLLWWSLNIVLYTGKEDIPEVLHVESRHIWWSFKLNIPFGSSLGSSTPHNFLAEGAIWNTKRINN